MVYDYLTDAEFVRQFESAEELSDIAKEAISRLRGALDSYGELEDEVREIKGEIKEWMERMPDVNA